MFQVGEVARQLGLNPQTLYFYERIGLMPNPKRTTAGYRLYDQAAVDRLAFITQAKALGLSLEDIKEILTLKDGRSLTCEAVYKRLHQKVQDIQTTIHQLQTLYEELVPLLAQCRTNFDHPDPTHQCQVLEQFQQPLKSSASTKAVTKPDAALVTIYKVPLQCEASDT